MDKFQIIIILLKRKKEEEKSNILQMKKGKKQLKNVNEIIQKQIKAKKR